MTEEVKVPKRIRTIVERCRRGETLHLALPQISRGETNKRYWFEPSGKPAPVVSTEQAIASGLLVAVGDTLFGGIDSQTYRAA